MSSPSLPRKKTKIICTIGPASREQETLERMMAAGMNIARINFAHGDFDSHRETIANVRAAAAGHRPTHRHHGRPARPQDAHRRSWRKNPSSSCAATASTCT